MFSRICQMWYSGLWQVFQVSESNTVEERTVNFNIQAKAAKHTKGKALQPSKKSVYKAREWKMSPPHYYIIPFAPGMKQRSFRNRTLKSSLSRKKSCLNYLFLGISIQGLDTFLQVGCKTSWNLANRIKLLRVMIQTPTTAWNET